MEMSPIGEAVLIAREGRRLKAYRDSKGIWTIGVGITSASGLIKVTPGLSLTSAECDALARRAFAQYGARVGTALQGIAVEPHEYDALVSLCFNIGPAAFLRSSVLRRLRAGDRRGAAEAILMWDRPAEIVPRRQAEHDQFRTPYATALPKARRKDARRIAPPKMRAAVAARQPADLNAPPPPPPSPLPSPPLPSPRLPEPPSVPARISWLARLRARLWPC